MEFLGPKKIDLKGILLSKCTWIWMYSYQTQYVHIKKKNVYMKDFVIIKSLISLNRCIISGADV